MTDLVGLTLLTQDSTWYWQWPRHRPYSLPAPNNAVLHIQAQLFGWFVSCPCCFGSSLHITDYLPPPMQLIPDVTQKTDVRLWNSAACAKATSSLKVVMMLCPSESGGGLAALHSIVLLLADESEVFSFQIQHLDDLTLEFLFYPAFGSKVGCHFSVNP